MVELSFHHDEKSIEYISEDYKSPFNNNFRSTLAWYFKDYPAQALPAEDDRNVVAKLLTFGGYLGDSLLGDDLQLSAIKSLIEEQGYENLSVSIESSTPDFFNELWESLILPDSDFVLSSVVKSFTRNFSGNGFPQNDAELVYNLKVQPLVPEQIEQFMDEANSQPKPPQEEFENEPLRILYIASQIAPKTTLLESPEEQGEHQASNSLNMVLNALCTEGAIDYEICHEKSWQDIQQRLQDKERPVHIVHYDGPVFVEENQTYLQFNSANKDDYTAVQDLAKCMVTHKSALLAVDARAYAAKNSELPSISATQGLALLASDAAKTGLGNVLGLGQLTDIWHSSHCFQTVYQQITQGLSLAQAVIEARKTLQSNTNTYQFSPQERVFHTWPLLVHYGNQPVTFFETPQQRVAPEESQLIQQCLKTLFGFKPELLPPKLFNCTDGQALNAISILDNPTDTNTALIIQGDEGLGKTHLSHVMGFYLVMKQRVEYGFYFNFQDETYTQNDILEMIAPVFELEPEHKDQVIEKLKRTKCCFVFDGLSSNALSLNDPTPNSTSEIPFQQFARQLQADQHKLIMVGEQASELFPDLVAQNVMVLPLSTPQSTSQSTLEAQLHASYRLNSDNLNALEWKDTWIKLIAVCAGNPWLINKIFPLVRSHKPDELLTQARAHFGSGHLSSVKQTFYEWQWSGISPFWQQILLLVKDVKGLLLETVMVAWDQKSGSDPTDMPAAVRELIKRLPNAEKELPEKKGIHGKFSEAIQTWHSAGFLIKDSYGHLIDREALWFLEQKQKSQFATLANDQQIKLHFSQILCAGIRTLCAHVQQQQNPVISRHLILNRRHWVVHFETLWFAQDYRGFMEVKNAFEKLLFDAQLGQEFASWCADLLNRSDLIKPQDAIATEAKLTWLAMAISACGQKPGSKVNLETHSESPLVSHLDLGATHWQTWIDNLPVEVNKADMALFQQSCTFLENHYRAQENWQASLSICNRGYQIFRNYQAWAKVIQLLSSMANYHVKLGQPEQAKLAEDKILQEVPYDDAPPGFEAQRILEVTLARLARREFDSAQTLLNRLETLDTANNMKDVIDGVQSDIYFETGEYQKALPHYSKVWVRSLETEQHQQLKLLKPRLISIAEEVGKAVFDDAFANIAPTGILKPHQYDMQLH